MVAPGRRASLPALLASFEAEPLFWPAARPGLESAWYGHVPFAHWLVAATSPRRVVELGTHNGVSFLAFCEAARRRALPTHCTAVDLWQGDAHAGFYDNSVHATLSAFIDRHYPRTASLLRMRFDQALAHIDDASIDLLHIDGRHRYADVWADFSAWRCKLSPRGVVLFHDTEERREDFGVHQFWAEITRQFPHFNFTHAHGLGVLAVGPDTPEPVALLTACATHAVASTIQDRFAALGARFEAEQALHAARRDNATLRAHVANLQAHINALGAYTAELESAAAPARA